MTIKNKKGICDIHKMMVQSELQTRERLESAELGHELRAFEHIEKETKKLAR